MLLLIRQDPAFTAHFDLERIVDDFVFLCFFVGNDFLPHLPHMDIADGALNMMLHVYRDMLPRLGGYLTDKAKIHLCRLELFLREIARREPLYFQYRAKEEKVGQGGTGCDARRSASAEQTMDLCASVVPTTV